MTLSDAFAKFEFWLISNDSFFGTNVLIKYVFRKYLNAVTNNASKKLCNFQSCDGRFKMKQLSSLRLILDNNSVTIALTAVVSRVWISLLLNCVWYTGMWRYPLSYTFNKDRLVLKFLIPKGCFSIKSLTTANVSK